MDDYHGTGPRLVLEQIQANLSQKILVRIWTVSVVGTRYEQLKCQRALYNDRTVIVPDAKNISK